MMKSLGLVVIRPRHLLLSPSASATGILDVNTIFSFSVLRDFVWVTSGKALFQYITDFEAFLTDKSILSAPTSG